MNNPPTAPSLILGHFIVAGLSWIDTDSIKWHTIDVTTDVRLERERFHPHDPLCISLRLPDGTRLGYIRRADNRILSAIMDQGQALQARLVEVDIEPDGSPRELIVEVGMATGSL